MPVSARSSNNTYHNIPDDILKWPLFRAAEEFVLDEETLRKRLVANDIHPDAVTRTYTTSQICAAVFDDSRYLKDREIKAKGTNWELKNKILLGGLLDRAEVTEGLERINTAVIQIIKASNLGKDDQKEILSNISGCFSILDNVARKQSTKASRESIPGEHSI